MDLVYSGGGNPRAEISACIRQIEASNGGVLTIEGEHVVDGTIDETATNLVIDFGETGKLILGDGLAVPVLRLRPAIPYTGTLLIFSPRIDCSRGRYIGGTLSSSAICPALYGRLEIYDCELYGGGNGDSGISPLGIVSGFISGGCIKGFADLGIYVTGGLEPAPHAEILLIEGVKIKNCRGGIDVKRRYGAVTVSDCKIVNCEVAYRMSWVGNESNGGPPIPPGLRMEAIGGVIRNPRIAFQPEGPAVLRVEGTKIVDARDALSRNQGGTLKGTCTVKGNAKMIDQNLTVEGKTYKPTTQLKVT